MNAETILLVEDNESDIDLTKRALRKGRIANPLVVAQDGKEALEYLFAEGAWAHRDAGELPALVLLDLKLPILDGREVLQAIRGDARTRLVPVVILTTSQEDRDIRDCYSLGANGYVRKPVDFNEFMETVSGLGIYWLLINMSAPA